ncbi:MAG: RDD family protein [Firmicutes bacterium]|nr:RDD family protein [Bacillota bacterium]
MKIKRVFAYIIDYGIVYLISALLLMIPVFSYDQEKYLEYYKEYTTIPEQITEETINNQYTILYKMTKLSKNSLVIEGIVTFTYFGIVAYLLKGQTIGKKAQKIKVVPLEGKELNPHLFMLRSVILTNLIPKIASIIAIMTLKEKQWILASGIISNISLTITFTLIAFLIFREDERSLHDIICKTKVIEVNKE